MMAKGGEKDFPQARHTQRGQISVCKQQSQSGASMQMQETDVNASDWLCNDSTCYCKVLYDVHKACQHVN